MVPRPRSPALAATAAWIACLATACSGKPPAPADPARPAEARPVEAALRLRVANAEARRGGGLAELIALAQDGPPADRVLALRGVGRVGGARAIRFLLERLADPDPQLVAAAAAALGVTASLDDPAAPVVAELGQRLLGAAAPLELAAHRPLVIEALGRAGDAKAQDLLAAWLAEAPPVAAAAAIALGRHGRRKLALTELARTALIRATANADAAVRYAAVWALSREQLPETVRAGDPDPRAAGVRELERALGDAVPEIRAQAIAALTRRKQVVETAPRLAELVEDPDWRVATELARAAAGAQAPAPMRASVPELLLERVRRARTSGPHEAQAAIEGLRAILANRDPIPAPGAARHEAGLAALAAAAAEPGALPPLARGWIECLVRVIEARRTQPASFAAVERCGGGALPDHLRLPLLVELIEARTSAVGVRRAALATLLSHGDPRVRSAGLGALAALWPDGDDADHRAAVATVAAAIGSADPIVAGTAVETAPAIYKALAGGDRSALDAAIVARARTERDVELATALLGLIGERTIAAGAQACRDALAGHPVRARAAAGCLADLGEAPAPPPGGAAGSGPPVAEPPPVDVAAVIGKRVRWTLTTSAGAVVIELDPDTAPWAVAAIVALTRKGFYDGLEFHRVVPDFVVQGGDPTQSGWGGPGFMLPAEPAATATPPGSGFVVGGVGIADAGRDSGGSQWFIMHSRAPHLDGRYTWIGRVVDGQKAADALVIGDRVVRAIVEIR